MDVKKIDRRDRLELALFGGVLCFGLPASILLGAALAA